MEFRSGEINALEQQGENNQRVCNESVATCAKENERKDQELARVRKRPTWRRVVVIVAGALLLGYAGGRAHQWKREREQE